MTRSPTVKSFVDTNHSVEVSKYHWLSDFGKAALMIAAVASALQDLLIPYISVNNCITQYNSKSPTSQAKVNYFLSS